MASFNFIVNPAAARGKAVRVAEKVKNICEDRKMDFQLVYTNKSGDATEFAANARDQFDCTVAVGGDGTINEIVNGLMGGNSKLGIVPVGSGNDFVRALDIPHSLMEVMDILLTMKTQAIDIGKAGNRYFQNGLGIGFDAWVVDETLKVHKLRGTAIYMYSVLKTIYSYEPPVVKLQYNDVSREEKFFMITVGNGISLGGGFKLTPNAIVDDGLFDLNIIRNLKKWEIYQNLLSVFAGKHIYLEQVTTDRADQLTINSEEGFAAHVDGELLSLNLNSLDVKLLPKALEVVVS
ncbi:MAG: diacylglycerol kinase family lipid kinase [Calditrichia bacterium]|nr:diacylglycerol kinase family lipid kinase [Calditrichia bacterium]